MKLLLRFSLLLIFCNISAQISGCTDPLSLNYNPSATVNNGTCTYAVASISPSTTVPLPAILGESSGLISWNNTLITHNDNADNTLYAVSSTSGAVVNTYELPGVTNQDWEEIAQDDNYIYIGDFGNNVSGSRSNLRILRVEKVSLQTQQPVIDTISFSYEDQIILTPLPANTTDYDCEAFIVAGDFIYLFTKQWTTKATTVYKLPKTPGNHIALATDTYNVQGLITGATYYPQNNQIALCGYDQMLRPFVTLLYDFEADNFFSGNKRKINIALPFHQVEGITTSNGLVYQITNERFIQAPYLNIAPKLHTIDLTLYLSDYINSLGVEEAGDKNQLQVVYKNGIIYIDGIDDALISKYALYNSMGQQVLTGIISAVDPIIDVSAISHGIYYVFIGDNFPVTKVYIRK